MNIPLLVCAFALLAGAGLIVSGVFVLVGLGWCLIAAGLFALAIAELLRRGMTGGR